MSLNYEDCKVFVSTVDSMSSAEGGIVIQVVGEMSNRGEGWKKFAQTFFLAEQPNGYFILNDIFRFIKEESEEEEQETGEQGEKSIAANIVSSAAAAIDSVLPTSFSTSSQPQSQAQHAHHEVYEQHTDFALQNSHGPVGSAAGVTIAPPADSSIEPATRSTLEHLAENQDKEPEEVVHLTDDLGAASLNDVSNSQSQPRPNGVHSGEYESRDTQSSSMSGSLAVDEPAVPPSRTPEPIRRPSHAGLSSTKDEGPFIVTPQGGEIPPVPVQAHVEPLQQSIPAPQPPKPAGPPVPKTWANLAANNSNKWKSQVVANTQGVSTSSTPSAVPSGSNTPAERAEPHQNATASSSSSQAVTQTSSRAVEQRDPNTAPRYANVETPYSIMLRGITPEIAHKQLRDRVSDAFALREPGQKFEYARLSYLDIDRSKSTAYVDFEKEFALKKALAVGTVVIDGVTLTIEAGKGNRRDASGPLRQTGDRPPRGGFAGGAGRGGPPQSGGRGGSPAQAGRGGQAGGQPRGGARGGRGRGQNE